MDLWQIIGLATEMDKDREWHRTKYSYNNISYALEECVNVGIEHNFGM